jgi:hypothetical protein
MHERRLTPDEASSAALIQVAIDELAVTGGRLVLPEMTLTLDRGLCLRSGVELTGQGAGTVLRKGEGRVYPLSGYHNYGMCDLPLRSTAGLEVGMTVSVHDNRTHGGFYETFATITRIDGDWVGLDHGIQADYSASQEPCLTTVYPLVFGHGIFAAALRDLRLEGNRRESEKGMGGCRGGSVYFARSRDLEVSDVEESDYHGEGLSFQMCRDVRILNCRFDDNTGNGLHPGAGSTNALFMGCAGSGNDKSGFFFCVRANHITVRDGTFTRNGSGMSIGTRDCHNHIDSCTVQDNSGPGVLIRQSPAPTEVHSCLVSDCRIAGNSTQTGRGQVEIVSDAHDLIFTGNEITGSSRVRKPGFFIEPSVRGVFLEGNRMAGCEPDIEARDTSLTLQRPSLQCGYGSAPDEAFLHLPV